MSVSPFEVTRRIRWLRVQDPNLEVCVVMDESKPDSKHVRLRDTVSHVQSITVSALVDVLLVIVLAVLVWLVLGVGWDVVMAMATRSIGSAKNLSVEILTAFVFIELFHSLSEYVRYQRIRVTTLLDASLAFVLREVWIGMYGGEIDWQRLLALAGMILVLGAVRTLAVVFSPSEREADAAES